MASYVFVRTKTPDGPAGAPPATAHPGRIRTAASGRLKGHDEAAEMTTDSTSGSAQSASPAPRKKGGRPRGTRRSAKVEVRVSAAEKAALQGSAREAGLTVSEYVRRRSLGQPVTARADRETRVLLRRIGVNLNQLARAANTSGATAASGPLEEALAQLRRVLTGLG